jgi:hypothetical protein
MNLQKILFWVSTGLLSALLLFSVSNYVLQNEMIREAFEGFGYPVYMVYPLAVLKVIGLAVLLVPGMSTLKEWAYAAFTINFFLAFFAHYAISDGQWSGAIIALVLLFASYKFKNFR